VNRNICFVLTSLQMGGLEKAMVNLASLFVNEGVDVTIVTLYRFKHFYNLDTRIRLIEPRDYRFNFLKFEYYIRFLAFFKSTIIDRRKFDVILTFHEYCNFQILLSSLFQFIPVVVSDRGSPTLNITFPSNIFRKMLYPFSKGIIFQTNVAKDIYTLKNRIVPENRVIANPLNKEVFEKEVLSFEKRENIICWFGRLHWEKGLDKLLKAYQLFLNENTAQKTNWKLKIIGGGPDELKLRSLAEQLGIADLIIWKPAVLDIYNDISSSKIFVLTSYREGYPNALIEAMSMGLVPISFDCMAGPSEIINDGINGFLVDVGDEVMLSKKIDYLCSNQEKLEGFSQKAIEVRVKNNPYRIGNEYISFLDEIIKNEK